MVSSIERQTAPSASVAGPSPTLSIPAAERPSLTIGPVGNLLLDSEQIERIEMLEGPQRLYCATNRGAQTTISASDLFSLIGLAAIDIDQQHHLTTYAQLYGSLQGVLSLFGATSVGVVLRSLKGCDGFLEVVDHTKLALPRFPMQFADAQELLATNLCLLSLVKKMNDSFERGELASCVERIRGGSVFLEAIRQLQSVLAIVPQSQLLGTVSSSAAGAELVRGEQHAASLKHSVIDKKEEFGPLRDEVLEQLKLQQPLFLAVLTAGGIFLSMALQPTTSGLVAMIFPIIGLGLAVKIAAHDSRVGQITYHLRFILKSCWEIVRRYLFNGSQISEEEHQVLREQGIVLPPQDKKHRLAPLFPDMHALSNRIVFLTMYVAALGIGGIRTYHEALHLDPLTLFIWTVSLFATGATMYVLQRRRVR